MTKGFTVAKNPARQRARQRILDEANAARNRGGRVAGVLRMKNLQQAVAIVRSRGLVKDAVLVRAGFNARKVPQDRRESGSPSIPPEGDRTAVESHRRRARKSAEDPTRDARAGGAVLARPRSGDQS